MLWARWSQPLVDRINSLSNDPAVGGLLLYAASAADSLVYLADMDERAFGKNPSVSGVNPYAIDIAHARWACTSALTAVDLGAGSLGGSTCRHSEGIESMRWPPSIGEARNSASGQ